MSIDWRREELSELQVAVNGLMQWKCSEWSGVEQSSKTHGAGGTRASRVPDLGCAGLAP
jgi:hypothetical protein